MVFKEMFTSASKISTNALIEGEENDQAGEEDKKSA